LSLKNPGLFERTSALSDNTLYLTLYSGTVVGEFNAITGAAINVITELNETGGLAVSGDTLFVVSLTGTVGEYNAATGAVISANFVTGLNSLM
jgi:hypothetical protein